MDLRAWMGGLLLVIFVGGSYLRVRARRRAGIVHDFGHPVLDNLLLLFSGVLLAAILTVIFYSVRGHQVHSLKERIVAYPVLILVGGLLTWLCNRVPRRKCQTLTLRSGKTNNVRMIKGKINDQRTAAL